MSSLKVAALVAGKPGAFELWTLRGLASTGCALSVVQARPPTPAARLSRLACLARAKGLRAAASRLAAGLTARAVGSKDRRVCEELFDLDELRAWWAASRLEPLAVDDLNGPDAARALSALKPDLIVRVSGGAIKPRVLELARAAALNLRHGRAPFIRGACSTVWAIIEGRPDWIGATIHLMDSGEDIGPVLWRGAPQLAPGDSGAHLLFRSHVMAVRALGRIVEGYARGRPPRPRPEQPGPGSQYRAAPGPREWLRYLRLDRGRRAELLLERGLEC